MMATLGLVSLFNVISTSMGYLIPKGSSVLNSGTIGHIAGVIKGLILFLRVLAWKWT